MYSFEVQWLAHVCWGELFQLGSAGNGAKEEGRLPQCREIDFSRVFVGVEQVG